MITTIDRRKEYRDRLQVYADNNSIKYLELLLWRKYRDEQLAKRK